VARTHRIAWSPSAQRDLDDILRYVARSDSVTTALRLYSKLDDRIESLRLLPRRGRVVPELKRIGHMEYGELIVAPYRIVFHLRDHSVGIVAVLDGRHDLEEVLIERLAREPDGI